MPTQIAFLTPMPPEMRQAIVACVQAEQQIEFAQEETPAAHAALVREADVIVTAGSAVDATLLAQAPRVRLVQKWGVGVDQIDLEAARRLRIPVAITAGANAAPVAEHALALMLAVSRRLPLAVRQVQAGIWEPRRLRAACRQVAGSTIGLLGFGNVARMLAHRLRGFDVRILYHSRRRADAVTERGFGVQYTDLPTLLRSCDILSLHLPLTASSRGLMDAAAFAQMKDGALFINTARGEIVDEDALHAALASGKLYGAGLDTLAVEPVPATHPLLARDDVVVTPHSAGSVADNTANIARHVFGNIARFMRGEALVPADLVVPPSLDTA